MVQAWIDTEPVTLADATAEAARLLAASRLPVFAGLGTDVAGARAAIALARRLGGVVDHVHASALLADLDVARSAGMMTTTPNEARLRADLLLLVGDGLVAAWPDLPERLIARPPTAAGPVPGRRRVIWLCPGRAGSRLRSQTAEIRAIARDRRDLPALIAALRARAGGRPIAKNGAAIAALDAVVAELRGARFGVAIWSAADLDPLSIETLSGLVDDLNAATRFSGLPLAPGDDAAGVLQVCGWTTGLPVRTGFGRGAPEHDPWRFDAGRLVDGGEADCAVWISAYRPLPPGWHRALPTIALTAAGTAFDRAPQVHIEVGRPGRDHDAVEYHPASGTLAFVAATRPHAAVSVASALSGIAAALPETGVRPC